MRKHPISDTRVGYLPWIRFKSVGAFLSTLHILCIWSVSHRSMNTFAFLWEIGEGGIYFPDAKVFDIPHPQQVMSGFLVNFAISRGIGFRYKHLWRDADFLYLASSRSSSCIEDNTFYFDGFVVCAFFRHITGIFRSERGNCATA